MVFLIGAGLALALNLPGHLSYDSVVQLGQGRTGVYNNWHPPVMAWLLGLGDAVIPGAGLFVVLDAVLIFGGLILFALQAERKAWFTPFLAAVLAASPLLLIYPAIVWKDVLFAGAALSGFACLTRAVRSWASTAPRLGWLAGAAGLLSLAVLARQTGAVVLPFAALAAGWAAAPSRPWRGWPWALGFLGGSVAMVAVGALLLQTRGDGHNEPAQQLLDLQTYDVVAAVVMDPGAPLAVLHQSAPSMEQAVRTSGVAGYSRLRIDPLLEVEDLIKARNQHRELMAAQWRDLILHQPLLYARVRARALGDLFLPDLKECTSIIVGIDGPKSVMRSLHLDYRRTQKDRAVARYGLSFLQTPVFSHAAYAVAALVVLAGLVVRRRPEDIAVAAMLVSALAFTATFFVVSIACDYRYLYDLDVAAMAAGIYAAATRLFARPAGADEAAAIG
jgi:hypothetical protein